MNMSLITKFLSFSTLNLNKKHDIVKNTQIYQQKNPHKKYKLISISDLFSIFNPYKSRGFDSRWGEFLNLPNPSGRTRPWGLLSL
jgi:hypothetical protein